ncbi:MAG: hypothetical protein ACREES_04175 [Stellaceae bacterium]
MREHSYLRALALAALLSAPFIQAALAEEPEQQAMAWTAAAPMAEGMTGTYDAPVPTVGN